MIVSREIEGYYAEKYRMRTTFTMTKYKISQQDVQMVKGCKSFDEYIHKHSGIGAWKVEVEEDTAEQRFNATTPIPGIGRVDTSSDRLKSNGPVGQRIDGAGSLDKMGNFMVKGKNTTRKTINASIWLSKQHPLSLDSFLPLL